VWNGNGVAYDAIGDTSLIQAILAHRPVSASHRASTSQFAFAHGEADVLVEAIAPPHALVVIGSSAAARALLPLASALGWRTTLVDHDPARLRSSDLPAGLHTACATPQQLVDAVAMDAYSSVVVMTHNLEQDIAYLGALRDVPVAYIGALGSRERVARMRSSSALAGLHVHAPAGLDIGSETPEEIALAIAAEIMAVINGRHGGHLRDNDGAIH
jgi:xanthine/CO dehydrogenase XdhC/CoxF family maturation factor